MQRITIKISQSEIYINSAESKNPKIQINAKKIWFLILN
jgi:hypothetical protein